MAGNGKRFVKVFIASPGDLAVERRAFRDQIELLNLGFGDGAGVEFEALGWEDTLAVTGRRAQAAINADIDACDVFVLALHRRWGQEAPDAKPYSSYTEEEFHRALARWEKTGKPEVFVFFKNVDAASVADPGEQLQKVLKFRKQLQDTRKVLYRFFEDEKGFAGEVDKHLRAYVMGELPKADAAREIVVLPVEYVREVEKEREKAKRAAEEAERANKTAEAAAARAEELALALAGGAAKAALEGRVEEAKEEFAKAVGGTASLRVLYLAYEFYRRTGDLGQAEGMIERWLAISGAEKESGETAAAYGNLGVIYKTRGELEKAEEMYRKALAINEKLGRLEGMAKQYGNLGVIYQTRGELEKAEEVLRK
ncbi:MAG: tetratricopeptide repeat protein [Planctomycetota bacterium]|nr:tetratricopeptide repeat protein [Planctomycetota bacterium]